MVGICPYFLWSQGPKSWGYPKVSWLFHGCFMAVKWSNTKIIIHLLCHGPTVQDGPGLGWFGRNQHENLRVSWDMNGIQWMAATHVEAASAMATWWGWIPHGHVMWKMDDRMVLIGAWPTPWKMMEFVRLDHPNISQLLGKIIQSCSKPPSSTCLDSNGPVSSKI
jgi:hypothetical protein